jgi:hypothetical protein
MLSALNSRHNRSIGSVVRATTAAILVGLAALLVACGGSSSKSDPPATLTSLSISPATMNLAAGAT